MNRLIQITLAVQVVGFVVLAVWWVLKPTGADPSVPFVQLQQYVQKYGPQRGVDVLGSSIFAKASKLCRREACIQARYGGNRGKWLTVTAATQRDPCLNFVHPPCGQTAIRSKLKRVLSRINSCSVVGQLKRHGDVRLRVQCGGVNDFVTVTQSPQGHWILAGDDQYPGFLPRLHVIAQQKKK